MVRLVKKRKMVAENFGQIITLVELITILGAFFIKEGTIFLFKSFSYL